MCFTLFVWFRTKTHPDAHLMSLTSKPRDAKSVATRIGDLPRPPSVRQMHSNIQARQAGNLKDKSRGLL